MLLFNDRFGRPDLPGRSPPNRPGPRSRHDRVRRAAILILLLSATARCSDQPAAPENGPAAARPPAFKIQGFLPESPPAPAPAGDEAAAANPLRANDPSAPPDTPLCGTAAREANAAAAALSPAIEAAGGACLSTACFDPLTDTFIGADGFRHVCQ